MFRDSATRLSGLSSALLGWRPDDFWRATPEELTAVLLALTPAPEASGNAALITQLKELFPDGSGN